MRWNIKIRCPGYLVAMVTKISPRIHQMFRFPSIFVTIGTKIISLTLHLVCQIVNEHLCLRNEYQICVHIAWVSVELIFS